MSQSEQQPDEAIVLAGGMGTRLRSVLTDLPKPMAPIVDKPFLEYVLNQLHATGFKKVIFSVGYKWELIQAHFGSNFKGMTIAYAVENVPLGTGGGIRLAFEQTTGQNVCVFNGDTMFKLDIQSFYAQHIANDAMMSIALKPMENFDRYGTVACNEGHRITVFEEKKQTAKGLINAGVYLINRELWKEVDVTQNFSFEKDIMERYLETLRFMGFAFDAYFIDIGIPADYAQAQIDLPKQFN